MALTYSSRVTVAVQTSNYSYPDGSAGFALQVSVTNPLDFPPFFDGTSPEACFVYSRSQVNTAQNNKFERIASIDDLRKIPVSTESAASGQYRSNVYSSIYPSDANMLGEKDIILQNLYGLYSSIRTIYSQIQGSSSSQSFVLPDYYKEYLDTLITDLINQRLYRDKLVEKMDVIKSVVIPEMEAEIAALANLQDITNAVYNGIAESEEASVAHIEAGRIAASDLKTVFDASDTYLSEEQIRKDEMINYANEISQIANNALSQIDKDSIQKKTTDIKTRLGYRNVTQFAAPAMIQTCQLRLLPACTVIRNIDYSKLAGYAQMNEILTLVKNNKEAAIRKLDAKRQNLDSYALELDSTKNNITTIEGKLLSINPSIDILNPQSAWYVTINVK